MAIQFARVTRNLVAVWMVVAFLLTMLAMPAAGQWLKSLLLDIDGKRRLPMIPLSQTTFSVRLVNVDFVRDQRGVVTHLVNIQNGARFEKQP